MCIDVGWIIFFIKSISYFSNYCIYYYCYYYYFIAENRLTLINEGLLKTIFKSFKHVRNENIQLKFLEILNYYIDSIKENEIKLIYSLYSESKKSNLVTASLNVLSSYYSKESNRSFILNFFNENKDDKFILLGLRCFYPQIEKGIIILLLI